MINDNKNKKIKKKQLVFCLIFLITFLVPCMFSRCYGVDETSTNNEILESQIEALNLSSFISEGEKYTKDIFPEVNIQNLFNHSITGNIDNTGILNGVLNSFITEIRSTINILATVLIIIIIHSILKAISENISNEGVSQVAYFIQYILIVAVVMSNFTQIINSMREAIFNLIFFCNTLIPILIALITVTRKYCNKYNARACNYFLNCIYWKYCCKYNSTNTIHIYSSINNF